MLKNLSIAEEMLTQELEAIGIDPMTCNTDSLVKGIVTSVLTSNDLGSRQKLLED